MSLEFNVPRFLAREVLRFNPWPRLKVMARGYNDDDKNFTELVWEDDKDLVFNDKVSYPQFQIWIN
jgi:hypothetical protein